jgi:hypothetical protein
MGPAITLGCSLFTLDETAGSSRDTTALRNDKFILDFQTAPEPVRASISKLHRYRLRCDLQPALLSQRDWAGIWGSIYAGQSLLKHSRSGYSFFTRHPHEISQAWPYWI